MRISDWSSDVCSSDLDAPLHPLGLHLAQPRLGVLQPAAHGPHGIEGDLRIALRQLADAAAGPAERPGVDHRRGRARIGEAAADGDATHTLLRADVEDDDLPNGMGPGKERGWKYVELSVAAASFKKRNITSV